MATAGPPPPIPLPFPIRHQAVGARLLQNVQTRNRGAIFAVSTKVGNYFGKGPQCNPKVAPNEWIVNQLAQQAGIAVLTGAILSWQHIRYFGVPFYQPQDMVVVSDDGIKDADLANAANRDSICYEAVVLDAWTMNADRHHSNIMVVTDSPKAPKQWRAVLFDHDRALYGWDRDVSYLQGLIADPNDGWDDGKTAWLRLKCNWRDDISDWTKIEAVIARVQSVSDNAIMNIVAAVPNAWLTKMEQITLIKLIKNRRDHLKDIMSFRRDQFPNCK